MTSAVVLYKNSKILPEKNFKVDSLADYLATLTAVSVSDFQYIKHSLNLTIKVQRSQTDLDFISDNNFNYCSIKNGTEKLIYYFIIGKRWLSKDCIALTLMLDTINSFLSDITLSDRTKILREHKKRWKAQTIYSFVPDSDGPDIDTDYRLLTNSADIGFGYFTLVSGEFFVCDEKGIQIESYGNTTKIEYIDFTTIEITYIVIVEGTPITRTKTFTTNPNYYYCFMYEGSMTESVAGLFSANVMGYMTNETKYKPIIDFYSEGITPMLYAKEETAIYNTFTDSSETKDLQSYYLIYMNETLPDEHDPNPPVNCFLCGDNDFVCGVATKHTEVLDPYWTLGSYELLILQSDTNNNGAIGFKDKYWTLTNSNQMFRIRKDWTIVYISGHAQLMQQIEIYSYVWNSTKWEEVEKFTTTQSGLKINLVDLTQMRKLTGTFSDTMSSATILALSPYWANAGTQETIKNISTLDRTLSTLVKVIKLPYSPTGMDFDGSIYLIDTAIWGYDSGMKMLKLLDNSNVKPFVNGMNVSINPFSPLSYQSKNFTGNKKIENEPKLYHSDFYQAKIVYDSFTFTFELEKCPTDEFAMNFVTTTTINSRFMFTFPTYQIIGYATSNYYNVMPIARNNELTLYNSAYLNYIRTGYNYDVKNKERQDYSSLLHFVGSQSRALGSFADSYSNKEGSYGMIAGAIVDFQIGIADLINNESQRAMNIEQKLNQAKLQQISVAGSDDIDLLTYYADNNKAKFMIYEVSEKMKNLLFEMFYYTGYVADYFGIPVTNTRRYFNFVSADIVFASVPNLPTEMIEDIRSKYSSGITFLHKYSGAWDFEQVKENVETNLW